MKTSPRLYKSIACVTFVAIVCACSPKTTKDIKLSPQPHFDPRSFGATADGITFDTAALQKAIDACAGTGGSVVLTGGVFLTKPLELRGNMTLHIEKNAVLLGSPDIADYPVKLPSNFWVKSLCRSLLYAEKADGLTISGQGSIDGNCQAMNIGPEIRKVGNEAHRPSLLRVFRSENVTVRNITFRNPTMWTQLYSECDNLLIEGVTVDAPPDCANLDGIDVCDSHHVVIRDCNVRSEDDGICLKSHLQRGLKDILVENNIVHVYKANAIKLGTGTVGPISDITIRNNKITYAKYAGLILASVDGSHVRNILVEDLEMKNVGQPIFIRLGKRREPPGSIDGITINRLRVTSTNPENGPACVISGIPDARVQNVRIKDSTFEMPGGQKGVPGIPPEKETAYPQSNMFWNTPGYAFFVRHADGVVMENVTVSKLAGDVRPWLSEVNARVEQVNCRDIGVVPANPTSAKEATEAH
ncbi:MAG: glycosyl hydrolase family 28 protein [bacterium]